MNRTSFIIPLALFVVILGVFYLAFGLGDRHDLPSPLIDRPFPEFSAPDLYVPERSRQREDLLGRPTLVNVWATWCPTCVAEHQMLMEIAATGRVRIVGVNYKDERAKALRWLANYGNPYDFVVEDADGQLGIELGVYGAPETFLLSAEGDVVYKRVGDVNERIWGTEILPRLAALEDASS